MVLGLREICPLAKWIRYSCILSIYQSLLQWDMDLSSVVVPYDEISLTILMPHFFGGWLNLLESLNWSISGHIVCLELTWTDHIFHCESQLRNGHLLVSGDYCNHDKFVSLVWTIQVLGYPIVTIQPHGAVTQSLPWWSLCVHSTVFEPPLLAAWTVALSNPEISVAEFYGKNGRYNYRYLGYLRVFMGVINQHYPTFTSPMGAPRTCTEEI